MASSFARTTFLYLGIILISACTRSESREGTSLVSIVTPERSALGNKMKAQGLALPSHLKPCFGVNVLGSGISEVRENSCSPPVGLTSGTAGAGETLSLSIPKGSDRTIELHVTLVQNDEAGPTLDSQFLSRASERARTFRSGAATALNIAKDEETIEISLAFPGLTANLDSTANAVCLPQPVLRTMLSTTGDLFSPAGGSKPVSPLQDSVFSFPRSSVGADGGLTTTGDLFNSTPGQSSIPLWLSSITRKPDLGTYFAVDQENHLYQIDPKFTGEQAEILKLDASNCPFAVPNCQAPAWMQAISAGYGKQLFGVDIEGRIYALGEGLPIPLATYIPAYMASFVYY